MSLALTDENTYNVLANGVAPNDGMSLSDQYTKIQAVITAVEGTGAGGVIVFPPGIYQFSQPLLISGTAQNSSISIVGGGWTVDNGVVSGGFTINSGTVFQPLYASGDVFQVNTAQGGGLLFANFFVDRINGLIGTQNDPTAQFRTTTMGSISTPPVGSSVPVTVTTGGAGIVAGSYLKIVDGSGNVMYGYLSHKAGTTWTVYNTSPASSATISSGALVSLQAAQSGATFNLQHAQNCRFDGVSTNADYDVFSLGSDDAFNQIYVTNCSFSNVAKRFAHVVGAGSGFNVRNCNVVGLENGSYQPLPTSLGANSLALHLDITTEGAIVNEFNWDTVTITFVSAGIYYSASQGTFADSVFDVVSISEITTLAGYTFQSSGVPQVQDIRIRGGFVSSLMGLTGAVPLILLDAGGFSNLINGININNCRFVGNGSASAALQIMNAVSNVAFTGCEVIGSGTAVVVGGNGVTEHVVIVGNNLGSLEGSSQGNGVGVAVSPSPSSTCRHITIAGNQVSGNETAAITVNLANPHNALCSDIAISGNAMASYSPSSSAVQWAGTFGNASSTAGLVNFQTSSNPGFNPAGPVTAPSFPGSGSGVLPQYPFVVRLFIAGAGSLTGVQLIPASGGSAVSLGSVVPEFFEVAPGETISFTGTASWTWAGL